MDARRQFHHDGECFEINPVTWYVLATYGVTVRGPTVDRLGVYLDVEARMRFVVDNLRDYWQPLAAQVREACAAAPDRSFEASLFEWCALGALRLHFTAFTGDVMSKRGAGEYGLRFAPPAHARRVGDRDRDPDRRADRRRRRWTRHDMLQRRRRDRVVRGRRRPRRAARRDVIALGERSGVTGI